MLNNFVIVGTVQNVPEIRRTASGLPLASMIVESDRAFRTEEGKLLKDRFKVILWRGIAEECAELCRPGVLVAVKGRLQSDVYEKDGKEYYNTEIIAERVSYAPSRT